MTAPVEFWFDFSSPYAYFAAMSLEERLARLNRRALWRPFLLGAALQITGMTPLSQTPLRGDYAKRDWERLAKISGLAFQLAPSHPYRSQVVARAFYWFEAYRADFAVPFAQAVFTAHFVSGLDPSRPELALGLARDLIGETSALQAWLSSDDARDKLKAITAEAIAKGAFGSPFFIADGEPFWGWDRLDLLERWLRDGEWKPAD